MSDKSARPGPSSNLHEVHKYGFTNLSIKAVLYGNFSSCIVDSEEISSI